MDSSCGYAPGNISLIFTIEPHNDPRKAGSRGVGFTFDKGVTAEVRRSNHGCHIVFFNKTVIKFPTVESVLTLLNVDPVHVSLISELPLGCGFGLSGASALAVAYAVNKLFRIKMKTKELAQVAHEAEVINKTGLGDVVNQYSGGFCVRKDVSSTFIVRRLPFVGKSIFVRIIQPIATKSVLESREADKITETGNEVLKQLLESLEKEPMSFQDILDFAYTFVSDSGLLKGKKCGSIISSLHKQSSHASMIILGDGIVADRSFPGSVEYTISDVSAHVL